MSLWEKGSASCLKAIQGEADLCPNIAIETMDCLPERRLLVQCWVEKRKVWNHEKHDLSLRKAGLANSGPTKDFLMLSNRKCSVQIIKLSVINASHIRNQVNNPTEMG